MFFALITLDEVKAIDHRVSLGAFIDSGAISKAQLPARHAARLLRGKRRAGLRRRGFDRLAGR